MIFHLDDKQVAHAYAQKYGTTDYDSIDIHNTAELEFVIQDGRHPFFDLNVLS